jgi:iron complex outermembrane receptor protein
MMLLSFSAFAQFSISGFVRDGNNRALENATVQIKNSRHFAVTDEFGYFKIDQLQAGDYSLLIKFLGYEDLEEHATVSSDVRLNLSLVENPMLTDEVVVTATRANDKTPTTYSQINKQAIQKQNFGQDLPFLLNWTPSVVTTSDAGTGIGYTGIRIRGSDGTRVNVTINGIPYNDSESLGTFWVDIPDIASSSQSVQIQRGAGTSTNGAGAFGAAINLQTNTRNELPYAELLTAAGSFGTFRNTISAGTGLLNDRWVIDGRISKIISDGFIDRAGSDLQSYYFSAGFFTNKTIVKAITFGGKERTYQAWYGVPESRLNNDVEAMLVTASNEGWNEEQTDNLLNSDSRTFNPYTYKNQVDDYQQDHYQLHFSHRLKDELTFNTALHYTPGKGYYEEYRYDDAIANYGLPDVVVGNEVITSTDLIRRRWLDNDFYGFTYSLNYEKEKVNAVLGGAWNRYVGDHFGEILWSSVAIAPYEYQYYFNDGDKRDFNIFLKTNYQISEHINAFVDLQYRRINYKTSGIENKQNMIDVDVNYDFFNPKAGLTYMVSDRQNIYVSYSVANKEPVRDDFTDNPGNTPKHETLHDIEMGFRSVSEKLTFSTNFYFMNYKNQLVLTGALNDVGASVRTNVDKSYRMGIETEVLVKLTEKLSWNVNLTLSENKIKEFTEVLYDYGPDWDEYNVVENTYEDTDISFSPRVIGGSGLSYTPFNGAEITLLTKYVGKQYLDNTTNNARSIDSYLVNDIRLGYTIHPSFVKAITVSFLINNILDEEFESNGYTWGYLGGGDTYRENYYYPHAGTNFMGMLTLKF